jgi:TM2 domain-containing membrane protein YozV
MTWLTWLLALVIFGPLVFFAGYFLWLNLVVNQFTGLTRKEGEAIDAANSRKKIGEAS